MRAPTADPLRGLALSLRALDKRVQASPLDSLAWLPLQIAWLSHDDRRPFLYRAGQRQGKTTAGSGELIFRCLGRHPFKKVKARPRALCLDHYVGTAGHRDPTCTS